MKMTDVSLRRVVIADDNDLSRQGLHNMLRGHHKQWHIREVDSVAALRLTLADAPADLLVMELRLPGLPGMMGLRQIRAAYPDMKLVVLSAREDRESILECLVAGVHGYVFKRENRLAILGALHTVITGGIYVPPTLAQLPVGAGSRAGQPEHGFTERQKEVLALLSQGRSTKDIARTLNLGVGTVKVHLAAIYRIVGAHNRMQAVLRAGGLAA